VQPTLCCLCLQVERLEHLLSKSIAYSEFLADKIKKEGEGAVAVKDGSVKGPGLPQPKLVSGGQMRPYQLVRALPPRHAKPASGR